MPIPSGPDTEADNCIVPHLPVHSSVWQQPPSPRLAELREMSLWHGLGCFITNQSYACVPHCHNDAEPHSLQLADLCAAAPGLSLLETAATSWPCGACPSPCSAPKGRLRGPASREHGSLSQLWLEHRTAPRGDSTVLLSTLSSWFLPFHQPSLQLPSLQHIPRPVLPPTPGSQATRSEQNPTAAAGGGPKDEGLSTAGPHHATQLPEAAASKCGLVARLLLALATGS